MNRIFKYALIFAFVGITMFVLSQISDHAKGADIVWDGEGADELGSNALNWVGDTVPTYTDKAVFNAISSKNCTYDINPANFPETFIYANYTGVVTQVSAPGWSGSVVVQGGTYVLEANITLYIFTQQGGVVIGNEHKVTCSIADGWYKVIDGINQDVNLSFTMNGTGVLILENQQSLHYLSIGSLSEITISSDITIENGFWSERIADIDFMNLTLLGGNHYSSNILCDNFTLYGNYIQQSGTFIKVYGDELYLYGSWSDKVGYYGYAPSITTNQQHWSGWLVTYKSININFNQFAYLGFNHISTTLLYVQIDSWTGTNNLTWNASSSSLQTIQWSWGRGESNSMYDYYQNGIYFSSDQTNEGGQGSFTSTFVGSHAFLLSRSSFLPASTDISDDVWLGIVFMSIATLITLFGYVRRIGLIMIISFLLLVIGTFASTQIWVELWTLPTLFILVNAVLMTHGLLRKV